MFRTVKTVIFYDVEIEDSQIPAYSRWMVHNNGAKKKKDKNSLRPNLKLISKFQQKMFKQKALKMFLTRELYLQVFNPNPQM